MSKDLFLIRHAKAEEPANSSMVRDIDRDLVSKGIMEAAKLGNFLSTYSPKIQKLFSSPAKRAFETSKMIAEQLKLDVEFAVETEESLYGGGARGYLSLLNNLPETRNALAIVGHNPDISFFAEYLTRDDTGGNLNTAGMIHLKFDGKWSEITTKSGSVVKVVDLNPTVEDDE
jgi:phosphohistidine phosphatase